MDLLLARPRGFCAGVSRAVETVERALGIHGAPVYVFHEIVHNGRVVGELAGQGAVFVEDIAAIPRGAVTVFSAHGVSDAVRAQAAARGLRVIDATCPMVAKVHQHAQRYARLGYEIVMIGHPGHEEVVGTTGSVTGPVHVVSEVADVERLPIHPQARVAFVTQTTLSVEDTRAVIDALRRRWPDVSGPDTDDICFATQNRQSAVRSLAQHVDVVLVLGARNSSNSNRLREVAQQCGCPAYQLEEADQLDPRWLDGRSRVGVTAGASVPEALVVELCERLRALGAQAPRELPGTIERVVFRLPDLAAAQRPAVVAA